jgi:O-antigen chain-terminating methyltransferase
MSDEKFVDHPPEGADVWREVWQEDRRYRARPSRQEAFLRMGRRIARRALEPDAERQKDFNIALLEILHDLRGDIEAVRNDLQRDLAAVRNDLQRDLAAVRNLIPVASERSDALVAALDQKIETVAVRIRDLSNPVIAASGVASRPADFTYRRLEDGLRGSEAEVTAAVSDYVARASDHQPLFDIGCGRGELLTACKVAGIAARGCDTNERSVADLRQRGFDVNLAGIPECFDGVADASLGSVAALHVVEHIPVDLLFALFTEAGRVLGSGGLLIIETPNAESMLVTATEFWRDPTHLAPRHPAALVLLGREHGFDVDEVRQVHPFPEGTRIATAPNDPPEIRRVIEAINDRLFAPQDLRLILRKR